VECWEACEHQHPGVLSNFGVSPQIRASTRSDPICILAGRGNKWKVDGLLGWPPDLPSPDHPQAPFVPRVPGHWERPPGGAED